MSVTPGALHSGKSARRGRAPGTLPRRVGHPSRRRLQDLRQARSHGEAHCVEAGIEEICKGQPPFRRETCGPTLLEAQRCRAQAACSRRASSLATSAARQRCALKSTPAQAGLRQGQRPSPTMYAQSQCLSTARAKTSVCCGGRLDVAHKKVACLPTMTCAELVLLTHAWMLRCASTRGMPPSRHDTSC